MHQLTLLFLYAVLVDGLVSVADGGGDGLLHTLSGFVSLFVLMVGFGLFAASVLTPRVPKRMVLPAVLFVAFCLVWGVLFGNDAQFFLGFAETLLALALLVGYRKPSEAVPAYAASRPAFTFCNFVFSAPVFLAVTGGTLGLCLLGAAQKVRCKVEESVGNYLKVQSNGIALEERRFRQGDREIRLIGMIHVARNGFYDEIAKAVPADSKAVVLVEGITDRQRLLAGHLDYSQLADLVGVSPQRESSFNRQATEGLRQGDETPDAEDLPLGVEYRSGDIDTAEFTPLTVQWIRALQQVLGSASLREAVENYNATRGVLETGTETVFKDILDRRNEHLLGEIQKMLTDHRTVIVPWGAKHMPGLQKEIERWGFVETGRARREALHFKSRAVAAMISMMDRMPAGNGR